MTTVLVTLLAVVVALIVVLVAGLLRSHAAILRALRGNGIDLDRENRGTPAASRRSGDISGRTPDGNALRIEITDAPHPTIVVFLTATCATCLNFWNAYADPRRLDVPGGARLVVVTKGEEAESSTRLRRFGIEVPVVMSTEAWDAYGVTVAPFFVYVDGSTGTLIARGPAKTWDEVITRCEHSTAEPERS